MDLQGSPTGCISRSVFVGAPPTGSSSRLVVLDAPGDATKPTPKNGDHEHPPSKQNLGGIRGVEAVLQHRPAKIARLSKTAMSRNFVCVGKCPTTWTIDSYCESCHG
jgi:hypothetical protein